MSRLYSEVVTGEIVDPEGARDLIRSALDFNPESSDALYLRAHLLRDDQAMTESVQSDLERALESDTFSLVDRAEAQVMLAELLVRTGRPGETFAVVEEIRPGPDTGDETLRQALYVEALAARIAQETGTDDGERFLSVLTEARGRYPDDPRFFSLELALEDFPSFRYRRELERLMRENERDTPGLLEALQRYALTAPVPGERTWAYETYIDMGGTNPGIALALAGTEDSRAVESFLELGGLGRRGYLRRLAAAVDEEGRAALEAALTGFTGDSFVDADDNGFWEERLTLEGGTASRWTVDRNQDGAFEIDLRFLENEPETAVILQPEGQIAVDYEVYPYARSVSVPGATGSTEYGLRPYAVSVEILEELPPRATALISPLELRQGLSGVDLDAVRRAATARRDLNAAGAVTRQDYLEQETVNRSIVDRNGDGIPEELITYSGGVPDASLRDIDGDGYFEVATDYVNGREVMTAIDENDDGYPEVTEYAEDGGRREWDLNSDRRIDVTEFGIWTDSVRRLFPLLEESE